MAYKAAWTLDSESGTLPLANFLLDSKRDYGTAENVLRQSLATLPPNSRYWPLWSNRLGDALRAQKRWDEAVTAYESTIVQAPDDWAAHIGLGWTRYERGDGLQAAMSEFQEAINAPKSQGNGQLAIAQALTREKRFEEADAWFAQALALNPDAQSWYLVRGNAALQAGNLALALAVYQEALARFPDFALAYYGIAYVYQLNEQPAQAITAIEQALVLMVPPNAVYYVLAGSIYEGAGDESQALHAYRQALLIDPQNAAASRAWRGWANDPFESCELLSKCKLVLEACQKGGCLEKPRDPTSSFTRSVHPFSPSSVFYPPSFILHLSSFPSCL